MKKASQQSPRNYQIDGKTFEYDPKTRGAFNVANPSEKLSRRKLDLALGKLQKQGFKSYEEKAKTRKSQGITKDIKAKVNNSGRVWYTKNVDTLPEAFAFLKSLGEKRVAYLVMRGLYNNQTRILSSKPILSYFNLSSSSRPSLLLQKKNRVIIENKDYNLTNVLGVIPNHYEIRFTDFNSKA